ncbi:MAG: hypothetical protein GXP37_04445 [Chloroflexi bacterium]|nr:hypothetical protein [Chloroflexota bacterium]
MPDTIRRQIEAKAQRAILSRAVFRTENAMLIAGSMLLAAFFPQPFPQSLPWFDWWTWLLLGGVGVAGIIVSTLKDPQEAAQAVADMFREEHDVRLIKDRNLRRKFEQALAYYNRLQEVAASMKSERLRQRTSASVRQMEDWVSNIYHLALRLQAYRADGILNRDRDEVPKSVRRLRNEIKLEAEPALRAQMQATLASKQKQWQNLKALDSLMEKAELQLDHSVAALGTVYSQLLLIGGKREIDNSAAQRLQEDVSDEVANLQDLVDSINQVYDYRFEGLG